MSHVVAVGVKIQDSDLEVFKKAAEECGLEFREGKKTFNWVGVWVNDYHQADAAYRQGIDTKEYGKCDYCFGMKGEDSQSNEIGLVRTEDGSLRVVFDYYGTGTHKLMQLVGGKSASHLMQAFGKHKAESALKQAGFQLTGQVEKLKDGKLKLTAKPTLLKAGLPRLY